MNQILCLIAIFFSQISFASSAYAVQAVTAWTGEGLPSFESRSKSPQAIFLDSAGNDSRQPMTNTGFPWSTIGRVQKGSSWCTGALVGESVMLTAAHCVLTNGEFSQVQFYASYMDGSYTDSAVSGWITVGTLDVDTYQGSDWAVVQLLKPLGKKFGFMGYSTIDTSQLPIEVRYAGYSNNFRNGRIAGVDSCKILTFFTNLVFGHNCSASGGGSGGPLFANIAGDHKVLAVHIRGHNQTFKHYTIENSNLAAMDNILADHIRQYRSK